VVASSKTKNPYNNKK